MLMKLSLRNLSRNPRRTLAILLTVAMGSGSIFIFRGFNNGIMNQYLFNTVHSRFGHGQINQKGYREKVFEKPWEQWMVDYQAVESRLMQIPGVLQLFPRIEFYALLTNGQITVSGKGQGIEGGRESKFFTSLNVVEGKTLDKEPDGVVLGLGLARALDLKVGDPVTVLANTIYGSMNGVDLTVTGIFHTGSKDFDDVVFRLPLKQTQVLLDTDKVESVAIGLNEVQDWEGVAESVAREFSNLEVTPFAVLDKVYYQHSVDWLDSQFGVIQIIILTIVILGIFNSVSTSILERKQEIGNLRANGESRFDVFKLLFFEGSVLGAIGAVLGIVIALAINSIFLRNGILMPPAPGLTRQFQVMIEFQVMQAVWSFVLGFLSALLATVVAGVRVAKLPIGEALRSV
jgi:putative ABC transport system permease protein